MRNSGSFMTIFVITLMLLSMKYTTKAQEVNQESGEVDTEAGEVDTESGEVDTETREDDTESGEVDTETGEDNTENRKVEEGRGISFPTYVIEPENEEGSGIPLPTPKENCVQNMNIAFLLDASDSVGPIGFQAIKNHAKRIVKGLHLSTCDNVGLITFSRFANSQTFPGSRNLTADVIARIDALAGPTRHVPLEFKDSKVNMGLSLAEHVLFKNQLEIGESPEKLVVVITDGQQSQQPFTSPDMSVENLAKKLSGKGVRLHILAVGNSASIPKLLEIAPDERNIFDESSLDDLIATLLIQKDGCERKLDIGFVLDSSKSIGPAKFKAIRKYTKKFLHRLDVSKCDHVGLINFNEFANSEIYFRSRETKRDIFKKLDDLESPLRLVQSEVNESRINLALLVADKILFTKQLGLRQSSEKFLVVMTDGHQTKTAYNPASSDENFVKKLTNKGVRIFVLAVGNDISIQELLKVTSEERNIFPEKQLDHLIANVLSKKPQLTKDSGKESDVIV